MSTITTTDSQCSPPRKLLGEELPVFCEACGYHLHGLPTTRCSHCDLLHLRCPECGHTQPVNALRPAMQQWLGQLRATSLIVLLIGKIVFLASLLVAWYPIGWDLLRPGRMNLENAIRQIAGGEELLAVVIYAFCCGLIARFLALRWRRGWVVGLVSGALCCLAMYLGELGYLQHLRSNGPLYFGARSYERPLVILGLVLAMQAAAGAICWPAWVLSVKILLPQKAGERLLAWQQSYQNGNNSAATDPAAALVRP